MSNYVVSGYNTPMGIDSQGAVKRLQQELGVKADGIWGAQTQAAYTNAMEQRKASMVSAITSKANSLPAKSTATQPFQAPPKLAYSTNQPTIKASTPIFKYETNGTVGAPAAAAYRDTIMKQIEASRLTDEEKARARFTIEFIPDRGIKMTHDDIMAGGGVAAMLSKQAFTDRAIDVWEGRAVWPEKYPWDEPQKPQAVSAPTPARASEHMSKAEYNARLMGVLGKQISELDEQIKANMPHSINSMGANSGLAATAAAKRDALQKKLGEVRKEAGVQGAAAQGMEKGANTARKSYETFLAVETKLAELEEYVDGLPTWEKIKVFGFGISDRYQTAQKEIAQLKREIDEMKYEVDEYWERQTEDEFEKEKKEQWLAKRHPYEGAIAVHAASEALILAKNRYDVYKDGTLANAFQHAYWNALMTINMGEENAKMFADAHEIMPNIKKSDVRYGYTEAQHTQMDYFFNAIGREVGCALKKAYPGPIRVPYDQLIRQVEKAVLSHQDKFLLKEGTP